MIYTDDEIPLEEIVQRMEDTLKQKRSELKHWFHDQKISDFAFIVLAKSDYDKLVTHIATNFSREAGSTNSQTPRGEFLTDLYRRFQKDIPDERGSLMGIFQEKVLNFEDDKTIEERASGRVFGVLWQKVKANIDEKNAWQPGGC